MLTEPAHVESADSLQEVVRYAAVHGKGGVYSAYVNSIQLYADRPWLHQVTVADTPGTDDPNPERDKITRKWIGRADAVVYVSFAGQAGMTNSDVKFLDENLAHVDPRRRIIAVNKCDLQPNTEAIRSHINSIRSSDDPRMESLFGDDEGIVLVSGLGGLICISTGIYSAGVADVRQGGTIGLPAKTLVNASMTLAPFLRMVEM